jgi:hypothetical protein
MSKTATFNQVIGSKSLKVSIPVTRLEKLIDRVDFLLENGNNVKALQILKPFLVDTKQIKQMKKGSKIMTNTKGAKKEAALALIAKLQGYGVERSKIIAQLQHDLQMSYANARHYVVNVAKI